MSLCPRINSFYTLFYGCFDFIVPLSVACKEFYKDRCCISLRGEGLPMLGYHYGIYGVTEKQLWHMHIEHTIIHAHTHAHILWAPIYYLRAAFP